MEPSEVDELISIFNVSASGQLSKVNRNLIMLDFNPCLCNLQDEFVFCWSEWIKKVARPSSALVVVDVQNDFISGSLAIINCPASQNGEDVSEGILSNTGPGQVQQVQLTVQRSGPGPGPLTTHHQTFNRL